MRRARTAAPILLLAALLGLPNGPAHAVEDPLLRGPDWITAEPRGLDLVATWSAPGPSGSPDEYRVEVHEHDPAKDEEVVRSVLVPAGTTTTTFTGLPTWTEHSVHVAARFGDHWSPTAGSSFDRVRLLSTLSFVDTEPIVLRTDDCDATTLPRHCDSDNGVHEITREFVLDAPMPIDVRLEASTVFDGGQGVDGGPASAAAGVTGAWLRSDRIPAGTTRGEYQIAWYGDRWRRYDWVRNVVTLASQPADPHQGLPTGEVLIAPDARQSVTIFEDDVDPVPTALMRARVRVDAGRTARVPVRLDHRVSQRVVIGVRTLDLSARGGRDYRAFRGVVVIAKGRRVGWVEVPTRRRARGPVTFAVRLQATGDDGPRLGRRDRTLVRIRG